MYSVISPEGCASILWKDAGKADEAAQRLKLTAWDALDLGIIERVISEKELGQSGFYTRLADRIEKELQVLICWSGATPGSGPWGTPPPRPSPTTSTTPPGDGLGRNLPPAGKGDWRFGWFCDIL